MFTSNAEFTSRLEVKMERVQRMVIRGVSGRGEHCRRGAGSSTRSIFVIAGTASLMIEAPHRNPLIGVRARRSCVLVGVGEVSLKENHCLRRILLPILLPTKPVP